MITTCSAFVTFSFVSFPLGLGDWMSVSKVAEAGPVRLAFPCSVLLQLARHRHLRSACFSVGVLFFTASKMFRTFAAAAKVPLRRCLHTSSPRSTAVTRPSRTGAVIAGSAVVATYLAWRTLHSDKVALDSVTARKYTFTLLLPPSFNAHSSETCCCRSQGYGRS